MTPFVTLLLVFVGATDLAGGAQVSEDDTRFVEKRMAEVPGNAELSMSMRMLGFDVEGTHVLGHLAKINNPSGRVSVVLPPGGCGTREYTTITALSHEPKCRLAINAGYFNVTDAACIGNLVADGQTIQTVPLEQSNVNFGIRNGRFAIGYFTPEEIEEFDQLVSGVTWLVRGGKNYVEPGWAEANITVQTSGDKYISNLASRTAVGIDSEGRLIVIQIDGSIAVGHNKRGVNMYQLADLLIEHGAVNAINLDGGGSSAMALNGVLVNYPSDNQPPSCDASGKFQCQRPVSTILCIHDLPGEGPQLGSPGQSSGSNLSTYAMVGAVLFAAGLGCAYGLSMLRGGKQKDLARRLREAC